MWEHTLGNGIVGGMMISGDVQGRKEAEYALKMLKGIDKCKAGKVAEYDYKLEVAGEKKTFRKDPNGYSLIIADQIMPSMTGLQLSKEISKCRPDIPIILCSGALDEHSVEVSTELLQNNGIASFIHKPFSMVEISQIIWRVFKGAAASSPLKVPVYGQCSN
ncbi:MAG: response regulator [Desulfobacterales bacterium]